MAIWALCGCGGSGGSKVERLGCDQYCAQAGSPQGDGPQATQVTIDSHGTVVAGSNGIVPVTLTCRVSKPCDGGVVLLSGPSVGTGVTTDCAPNDGCAGRSNLDLPAHATRTIGVPLTSVGHELLKRFGRAITNVLIEFPPASDKFSPVELALSSNAPSGVTKLSEPIEAMATTPGKIWVATGLDQPGTSYLEELNAQTGLPVGSPTRLPSQASSMLVVSGQLWVGTEKSYSSDDATVVRINPATGRELGSINLNQSGPPDLTTGAGDVWCLVDDGFVAVDPLTYEVSCLKSSGSVAAEGIAVTNSSIWLADQTSALRYSVVNGKLTSYPVPGRSWAVAAQGNVIWSLEGLGSTTVNRFNASTGSLIGTSRAGQGAQAITFGDGSAWLLNESSDTVSRLSASTGAAQGPPIPVGPAPNAIAFGDGTVWVANSANATLTAINASTGVVRSIGG